GGIVDEVLEVVHGGQHRLVARRDHVAPPEAAAVGEEPDADGAALRDQPDVAGQERGIGERLDIDGAPRVRIHDAHAVGAAERDAGLATDSGQLVLAAPALVAALGEATVEDDGGAHTSHG